VISPFLIFLGNITLDNADELDQKVLEKNESGKIKQFHVTSPSQLLALLHLIKTTIFDQDILFVFHGLTALLTSEKVLEKSPIPQSSLV
jgi:hypothetical protein